jgi:hypothetical protein
MAKERVELLEWLRKVADGQDVSFLRDGVKMLAQALMEMEVWSKPASSRTGTPYEAQPWGKSHHSSHEDYSEVVRFAGTT